MIIRELRLQRYGCFEDVSLTLGAGCTVVFGPNEAGKSTLLDGLSDFLWGINSHSHLRAFNYLPSKMLITAEVDLEAGRESLTRRLMDLTDADGPVDESPWNRDEQLSAQAWRGAYGLDLARLEGGGRAVLDGGGDLAELVFLAKTGVAIGTVRSTLFERCEKIYRERRNVACEVRTSLREIAELQARMKDSEASAADVTELRARLEGMLRTRKDLRDAHTAMQTRALHLDELTRCFTTAAQLRATRESLASITQAGPVLTRAQADQLQDAITTIATAQKSIDQNTLDIAKQAADQRKLALRPDVVAHAAQITKLAQALEARKNDRTLVEQATGTIGELDSALNVLIKELGEQPQTDPVAQVAQLRLPGDQIDQLGRLAEALTKAEQRVSTQQQTVEKSLASLPTAGAVGAGQPDELERVRDDRDQAWAQIRTPWLAGVLPEPAERHNAAENLTSAITTADHVAETLADQLALAAESRGKSQEAQKQLDRALSELQLLQDARDRAEQQWAQFVVSCGLTPGLDPAAWAVRSRTLKQIESVLGKHERESSAVAGAAQRLAEFAADVATLADLIEDRADDDFEHVDRIGKVLLDAQKAHSASEVIDDNISELQSRIEQSKNQQELAQTTVGALVGGSTEEPEALLTRSRRAIELTDHVDSLNGQIQSLKNPQTELAALLEELAALDPVRTQAQRDEVTGEIEDNGDLATACDGEIAVARQNLAALESSESVAELAAKALETSERLRTQVDEYRVLRLQLGMLDAYSEQLTTSAHSPVLDVAGGYLERLTQGRFVGFDAVVDGDHRRVQIRQRDLTQATGPVVPVELNTLSAGTADQVFLALRLAGIEARQRRRIQAGYEALPVILDDVLVAHDDERSKVALALFAELAAGFQIVLLTHHRSVLQAAEELEDVSTCELANPEYA